MANSSEETTPTEGEGTDGTDKPPHNGQNRVTNLSNHLKAALNLHNNTTSSFAPQSKTDHLPKQSTTTSTTVTLPPPESGLYEKDLGYTQSSLQKLALTTISNVSTTSSPTESDIGCLPMNSLPPTRPSSRPPSQPPSQPPSRAPSMSSGVSGNKVVNGTSNAKKPTPQSSNSTVTPSRPKPASVNSDSGSHKFNLKDLLASGPKINRRGSQRSVGSSISDAGSDGGKGRARSTAGDSAVSFSQKYGVCQKVAVGKGATSVVRLAHKWDRTEEKLYAVKVRIYSVSLGPGS